MKIITFVLPVLIGFAIDLFLGDPHSLPHPIRLIGRLISAFEALFRGLFDGKERIAGILTALCVLIISTSVPTAAVMLCYRINIWLGVAVEGIMCYYLIAPRCLFNESMAVYKRLEAGDTDGARSAVSMIVGRDTDRLDEVGITKAAVETVAENTSDGVTAPLMFIMLGGAPLGFFYKAANTLDSMIGYKNDRYIDFGRFAAKLDDILNFIPSRFTALLMIFSAYVLRLDWRNAYKIWRRDRLNHASPNSAQTEAVCAGALNVRLAGNAYYFGKLCEKKTIGDDIRPIEKEDIKRANALMYCTSAIMLILVIGVRAFVGGLL